MAKLNLRCKQKKKSHIFLGSLKLNCTGAQIRKVANKVFFLQILTGIYLLFHSPTSSNHQNEFVCTSEVTNLGYHGNTFPSIFWETAQNLILPCLMSSSRSLGGLEGVAVAAVDILVAQIILRSFPLCRQACSSQIREWQGWINCCSAVATLRAEQGLCKQIRRAIESQREPEKA